MFIGSLPQQEEIMLPSQREGAAQQVNLENGVDPIRLQLLNLLHIVGNNHFSVKREKGI